MSSITSAKPFSSQKTETKDEGGTNWLSIIAVLIAIIAAGAAAYFFWFKKTSAPLPFTEPATLPTDISVDVGQMDVTQ